MKKGVGKKHKLPERLPFGEILNQTQPVKKQWRLGDLIGHGGFGLIYTVFDWTDGSSSQTSPYVIKVEPLDNGPLFCEFHFYQRAAKPDQIHEWTSTRGLPYLGVPEFHGWGQHSKGGHHYRFLVLQRLSFDLQKVFVQKGRLLPQHTALAIGLRMLDAVEYIHAKGYCHADIKAANILLGFSNGATDYDQVYLVDYGLVSSYLVKDVHRAYKQDPKQVHNGTVEFTSRDAHNGAYPARRGDVETLGYCLLQWMIGRLPWEGVITNPDRVCRLKTQYMKDVPELLKACFGATPYPEGLGRYLQCVSELSYETEPPYHYLRQCLGSELRDEWILGLSEPPPLHARGVKRTKKHAGLSTPQQSKMRHTSSRIPRGPRLPSSDQQHNTPRNSRRLSSSSSSSSVAPSGSSAHLHVAYPAASDSGLFKTPRVPHVTSSAQKARVSGRVRTPQRGKVSTPVVTPSASRRLGPPSARVASSTSASFSVRTPRVSNLPENGSETNCWSSGETEQDWDDWQTDGADFDDYQDLQDDGTTKYRTEYTEGGEEEEEETVEDDDDEEEHSSWSCLIL